MKLEFRRIHENDELLPAPVCSFLMPYAEAFDIRTAEIDPAFADGENMHTQYGVNYEEELNCLVVEGSRTEIKRYAALVVLCKALGQVAQRRSQFAVGTAVLA